MQNEIHRHEVALIKLKPTEVAQKCYTKIIQDESSNHYNTADS